MNKIEYNFDKSSSIQAVTNYLVNVSLITWSFHLTSFHNFTLQGNKVKMIYKMNFFREWKTKLFLKEPPKFRCYARKKKVKVLLLKPTWHISMHILTYPTTFKRSTFHHFLLSLRTFFILWDKSVGRQQNIWFGTWQPYCNI